MSHMAFKMCKDLSFIRYSAVSASMIRNCLKPEFRKGLAVREEMNVIVNEWAAGKPKLEGVKLGRYQIPKGRAVAI